MHETMHIDESTHGGVPCCVSLFPKFPANLQSLYTMTEFTDTAIPVSFILKMKGSKLSVYGERKEITPSPNDLAFWLFSFFIVTACFFHMSICLWEMFIHFDASCREKPLSTFQQITHKYMSFVRELDLAMCLSPSSNGSKMRSLWTNQMKSRGGAQMNPEEP